MFGYTSHFWPHKTRTQPADCGKLYRDEDIQKNCCGETYFFVTQRQVWKVICGLQEVLEQEISPQDKHLKWSWFEKLLRFGSAKNHGSSGTSTNVSIAIINHPPHHHFYGWYKPSKMGRLWHCYAHITWGIHAEYVVIFFEAGFLKQIPMDRRVHQVT